MFGCIRGCSATQSQAEKGRDSIPPIEDGHQQFRPVFSCNPIWRPLSNRISDMGDAPSITKHAFGIRTHEVAIFQTSLLGKWVQVSVLQNIASVISHNWFQSTRRDSNHGLPLARGILSFLNYSCLIFMWQMQIEMVDLFYDGAAHSSSYPPTHWIMASFPFSGDYLIVIVGRNWQLLPTTLASRSPKFVGYEI